MKIKILRCLGDSYWYRGRIGEIFEVDRKDDYGAGFVVFNGPSIDCKGFVALYDCEKVDESELGLLRSANERLINKIIREHT